MQESSGLVQKFIFCISKTARRSARPYLFSCLHRQTYARVGVRYGVPVGIIMGADKRLLPSRRFSARLAWAEWTMLCSREGLRVLRAFSSVDSADCDLLQSAGTGCEDELSFFAAREDCRRTANGKRLFAGLLKYMNSRQLGALYFYTDSSRNYRFYERQGMARRGEKTYQAPFGVDNEMKFYLYAYDRQEARSA